MFQSWRIKLREVEQALRAGRLDEAGQRLRVDGLREYQPGQRLAVELAQALAKRAGERVTRGESSAGWADLSLAMDLAGDRPELVDTRQRLIEQALNEARCYLEADDPATALATLERLQSRRIDAANVRLLVNAARHLLSAGRMTRRGEYLAALDELQKATELAPELASLERRAAAVRLKMDESSPWREKLQQAVAAEDWQEVVSAGDALLRLSPDQPQVREIRDRAWSKLARALRPTMAGSRHGRGAIERVRAATPAVIPAAQAFVQPAAAPDEWAESVIDAGQEHTRFVLWIDAVGGFLVCLGSEIVIGQPVPGGGADVPILGDLSRKHAVIRRESENYVIEPFGKVKLDGMPISTAAPLVDGAIIELGSGVKLRFRRPSALTGTARLEFASHHRTKPNVDAVILMATACILGPNTTSHVVCPEWTSDVVLYRDGSQLMCRAAGTVEIDGAPHDGRGSVSLSSHVTGDEFALHLEAI